MRKILFLFCLLPGLGFAQDFTADANASHVDFVIRNFGVAVEGSFKGLSSEIHLDINQPHLSYVKASVAANSVDTGINLRDKHLKKEEYFDAQNFPLLKFESEKIEFGSSGWQLTGTLTIKKKTKRISLPFTLTSSGNQTILQGEFAIDRRDFDVGGNSLSLSNEVSVTVRLVCMKAGKT